MAKTTRDSWNPTVLQQHPIYWPVSAFAADFVQCHAQWPDLADYQHFLEQSSAPVTTVSGQPIRFVAQGDKPQHYRDGYEPRIFLKGEVQTRLQNWHDFFQVLVWRMFPATKATLNALHYEAIRRRIERQGEDTPRSRLENALTQFDECGAVIISSSASLLNLIRQFEWKTLFWQHRHQLEKQLKCIVFGHAIYEKAINPYLGMTAHSLLLQADETLLHGSVKALVAWTDEHLQSLFHQDGMITSPRDFSPFPLLGMPGWHAANEAESFYDNVDYFRPGRRN